MYISEVEAPIREIVWLGVPAGVGIGVCGHTEGGKRTLLMALRAHNLWRNSVITHSMDHRRMSLPDLRRGMPVGGQELFLINGLSVRKNFPFGKQNVRDCGRCGKGWYTVEYAG